jgi:hypothetical protein
LTVGAIPLSSEKRESFLRRSAEKGSQEGVCGLAIGFDRFHRRIAVLAIVASAVGLAPVALPDPAAAQTPTAQVPAPPPPVSRNPGCTRLEAQLAAIDRGEGGNGRAEQIRRYEDAANRQQQELDRMSAQAQRAGCRGGGFFLFGGGQPAQCDRINGQLERMRANLDRIMQGLRQLQSSGNDRTEQRQAILISLSQNDCGPQYRSASAPPRPRGFFETLFGGGQNGPGGAPPPEGAPDATQGGSFHTVCVRTCDGSFFPISYATSQARFAEDDKACHRMCPAAEVQLFTFRNPGETIAQAVSTRGQPYTSLPNAFRYRQEYNPACTCKRAGESWAQAVGEDPSVERGDVVVTEENARTVMAPKKPEPRGRGKRGHETGAARGQDAASAEESPTETPPSAPTSGASTSAAPPRSVGPQFYR